MRPAKPCSGSFDRATQEALIHNADRAQWKQHRCEVCSQFVEAQPSAKGWVPAVHWPSVNFGATQRRSETRIVKS